MTALQTVELRYSDLVDPSILELLRSDEKHGFLVTNIGGFPDVPLSPLTSCSNPVEIGYIKKLLESGYVGELMCYRRNRDMLPRAMARQVKHDLSYVHLARRLEIHAGRLGGPLRIVRVWSLHLKGEDGHTHAMLSVIFTRRDAGSYYGYYFHIKSALYLCGLLHQ